MADNSVFISGAAEGALAGALEGLPPWATEDTAKNIEGILRKSLGIQTKALSELIKRAGGGKPMSPADAKKLDDELRSIIKNFRDANKDFGKQRKRWKDEADEHERKKKWWNKEFQLDQRRYSMMGLYVALGSKIREVMTDNVKTFDELHASGINVMNGFDSAANGFEAVQQLAAITGVRFTELSATIVKYNAAINSFGLEKFAKTVSMSTKEMFKFGFTAKESADLLGAYLETQRGFVDMQSKTQAEVTADLVKFGKRITKVSVATGMLRTQILANLDAISKQVETSVLAGQVGEEAAEKTAEFIASFKDQKIGQAFLKMMTDQIKPLNATFMDFQKIGFGGFGQKLMNFTRTLQGLEPEEAQRRVAEFMAANKQEVGVMRQRANMYSQLGMREADGVLSTITGLEQQARAYKKVSAEERKRQELASTASKALQTSWEKFKAQLQITFAPLPKILDMLTFVLEKLNDGAELIRGWVTSLDNFVNSFKIVKDTFGEIKSLNIIGSFIAITGALSGMTMAVNTVKYAFSLLPGSIILVRGRFLILGNALKWVGGSILKVGGVILNSGKFIFNALGSVGGALLRLAPMLLRILGPIGLVITAFQLGSAIGETLYETLSQFNWFNDSMDFIFSTIESAGTAIMNGISNIGTFFSDAGKTIAKGIDDSGNWVSTKIKETGEVFASGIALAYGLYKDTVSTISDGMASASTFVSNGYKNIMKMMGPKTESAMNSFFEGVTKVKNFYVDTFKSLFAFIGNKFTEWFPWTSTVSDFLSNMPNKMKDIFNNLKLFGESYVDALKNFLFTVLKKFTDKMIPDFLKFWKSAVPEEKKPGNIKKEDTKAPEKSIFDTLFGPNTPMVPPKEEKVKEPEAKKIVTVSLPDLKTPVGASRLSTPKPSELNSPSEVSTKQNAGKEGPVDAKKVDIASGAGLRKKNTSADINTVIGYQTSVLEQILQSTNSLGSVNQDILKYTRVQS